MTEAEEVPERLAAGDVLPLPGRDGVPTETLLGILLHPVHHTAINTSIPAGRKEKVYCVVDNKRNLERKGQGRTNVFDDDCGAWKGATSCKFPYLITGVGEYKRIFLHDDQYCREQKSNGCRVYVALDSQPCNRDVVTVTRYTVRLAADSSYRHRVSYISSDPPSTTTVVEYFGTHRVGEPHGNSKNASHASAFMRTPAATVHCIADAVQRMPAKEAYDSLTSEMEVDEVPRDSQVVRRAVA